MKKSILFAATLLLALGTATAQDTLTMNGPKTDYMYLPSQWYDTSTFMLWDLGLTPSSHAVGYHPHGEVTVYGIAAIVMTPPEFFDLLPEVTPFSHPVIDTTMSKVGGYLRFYDFVGNTLVQRGNDLWVGKGTTPVNYYLRFNFDTLYSSIYFPTTPSEGFTYPVYERYFDSALTVTDSFFVGLTDPQFKAFIAQSGDTLPDFLEHHPVSYPHFNRLHLSEDPYNKPTVASQNINDQWSFVGPAGAVFYIFPILTPGENLAENPIDTTVVNPIDTTGIDTTGVGIADVQLVGRYVSLQPNPAAERVLVTSSFGLQRVEIYNVAGARVRDEQASGYTATLTVGDLPEGAYLLRIYTPLGATTKKLVVKR